MKSFAAIRRRYHEKISCKTFVQIMLFIIIMATSFTTMFIMQESALLTDNIVKKEGLLAELLAYNTRLCVFAENKETCAELARGLLSQEEIRSVLIFTAEGRLLAKQEKPGRKPPGTAGELDKKRLTHINKNIAGSARYYLERTRNTLDFWAPVLSVSYSSTSEALFFDETASYGKDHIIGYAEIIIDKGVLDKQLAFLLLRGILMGVVFLIIGFASTYLATIKITRPIEKLSAASAEISRGNLDIEVEVTSGDEIGRLSQSFNKMAMNLKESEKKYKDLN